MKINKEEWRRSVYEYPFREGNNPPPKEPPRCEPRDAVKYVTTQLERIKNQLIKKIRGVRKDIKNIWRKCNEASSFLR